MHESMLRIGPADLDDPRIVALLLAHTIRAVAETARGSAHALDQSGLRSPDISVWAAWDGDEAIGVGALRRLSAGHGELKSMFTSDTARRRGVGRAMLRHLIATARADGLERLSLETGAWDYFRPAHALYRSEGFADCAPFGDYRDDPNSLFLTLAL
jgi:putative acetyltransferase